MTNFEQIILEAIKLLLAGIAGGLIGARANDKLTRAREREAGISNRKRDFLAFMTMWRREVDKFYSMNDAIYKLPGFFNETIANFCGAAETIRNDFIGERKKRFETLIGAVSSFFPHKSNRDEFKPLLKAIDDIIVYVNAD